MTERTQPPNSGEKLSGVERLNRTHEVKGFRCGRHSLDVFLTRHALRNQDADSSQTYVVTCAGRVVGYYSLTVGSVEREDCSPAITSEMPPNYPIPVVLLARLAIDLKEQGKGLGAALLKDAFFRIASAADIVGVRAVLVHALDAQAKAFYQHFDFEEFPSGTLHLMLSLKQVRGILGKRP